MELPGQLVQLSNQNRTSTTSAWNYLVNWFNSAIKTGQVCDCFYCKYTTCLHRPRCVHREAPQRFLCWDGRPWSWAGGGPGPPLLEDQDPEESTPPVISAGRRSRRHDQTNIGSEARSRQQFIQSSRTG
ncbi:hypothetical protein LAZ67_3001705 [Cordylochernes scorpioides]|uniref:Uncharacterized protein n=1 Tax=Cordylochernes scorpioides TaxID=51811 RepID=A0ABY6K759_9ARAC|nr:hypothetical protein LAZ67_3001705 [Cordylochernes scorpioides]